MEICQQRLHKGLVQNKHSRVFWLLVMDPNAQIIILALHEFRLVLQYPGLLQKVEYGAQSSMFILLFLSLMVCISRSHGLAAGWMMTCKRAHKNSIFTMCSQQQKPAEPLNAWHRSCCKHWREHLLCSRSAFLWAHCSLLLCHLDFVAAFEAKIPIAP